jgi:hypothetical protein
MAKVTVWTQLARVIVSLLTHLTRVTAWTHLIRVTASLYCLTWQESLPYYGLTHRKSQCLDLHDKCHCLPTDSPDKSHCLPNDSPDKSHCLPTDSPDKSHCLPTDSPDKSHFLPIGFQWTRHPWHIQRQSSCIWQTASPGNKRKKYIRCKQL